jgi:intracellular septation protein
MTATAESGSAALPVLARDAEDGGVHPIVHAGKWLIADLFSTLLFVGLYAVTHSVFVATGLAIVGGIGQIAYLRARGAAIDAMQWLSLALVVVFGVASLMTHDARFIMLKPSLIYVAVGAVMLRPGWMLRYQPPVALRWGRDVAGVFGYVWAGLMFATAALNLAFVAHGDAKLWAWFVGVAPLASKLGLFAVQYLTTRLVVAARMRAAAQVAA